MGCGPGAVCSSLIDYLNGYIGALHSTPGYWSFHDYDDVTAAGVREQSPYAYSLDAFYNVLVSRYGSGYEPADLDHRGRRAARPAQHPGARRQRGPQCDNGELDAYNLIGPAASGLAPASTGRRTLTSRGSGRRGPRRRSTTSRRRPGRASPRSTGGPPNNAAGSGWDSALLDIAGLPRSSYCVLAYGEAPSAAALDPRCPGSPLDGGDPDER